MYFHKQSNIHKLTIEIDSFYFIAFNYEILNHEAGVIDDLIIHTVLVEDQSSVPRTPAM